MVCMCSELIFDLSYTVIANESNAQHDALNVRDVE